MPLLSKLDYLMLSPEKVTLWAKNVTLSKQCKLYRLDVKKLLHVWETTPVVRPAQQILAEARTPLARADCQNC